MTYKTLFLKFSLSSLHGILTNKRYNMYIFFRSKFQSLLVLTMLHVSYVYFNF